MFSLFTHVDSNHFTDKGKDNEPHCDLESEYPYSKHPKQHLVKVVSLGLTGQINYLIGAPPILI